MQGEKFAVVRVHVRMFAMQWTAIRVTCWGEAGGGEFC